jgi:hypothetical protein
VDDRVPPDHRTKIIGQTKALSLGHIGANPFQSAFFAAACTPTQRGSDGTNDSMRVQRSTLVKA